MERIFEPKNDEERYFVNIIKTNTDKVTRKKALINLLKLNGFEKNELFAIRSVEVYARIPNKPPTWRRFHHATVVYNTLLLKR